MAERFSSLVRRAQGGDNHAREVLVEQFLPGLRAFVRLRTGPVIRLKESNSDLVQSICREVLVDLPHYRGDSEPQFRSWLFSLALRKILDKRKFYAAEKRDVAKEVPLETSRAPAVDAQLLHSYAGFCTPSRYATSREEIERIEAAFSELPEDYQEVITLGSLIGLPQQEIAARLETTEGAVRQLLYRARARLAMLLAED